MFAVEYFTTWAKLLTLIVYSFYKLALIWSLNVAIINAEYKVFGSICSDALPLKYHYLACINAGIVETICI